MQRQPTTRLLYITPELAATQSKIKKFPKDFYLKGFR